MQHNNIEKISYTGIQILAMAGIVIFVFPIYLTLSFIIIEIIISAIAWVLVKMFIPENIIIVTKMVMGAIGTIAGFIISFLRCKFIWPKRQKKIEWPDSQSMKIDR